MDLICYLHETWRPWIRPAESARPWMDATQHSFAYRCLPLSIANSNGWEILSPCAFEATWSGGKELSDVFIDVDPSVPHELRPQSMFGHGTFTFHVMGLFRTEPGWNLWIGGSPNRPKDCVYPLTGIIETDWSPYTFTMNWMFTRRNRSVKFEKGEPIGFFFPISRAAVEETKPVYMPIQSNPELMRQFGEWSKSRDALRERMAREPAKNPSDQWQKYYYRGIDMDGKPGITDHRSKIRPEQLEQLQTNESTTQDIAQKVLADAPGICPYHLKLQEESLPQLRSQPEQPSSSLATRSKRLKRTLDFRYKSDPFGTFVVQANAASLGQAIRAIADGLQKGADRASLIEQLKQAGFPEDKAETILGVALAGSPRLFA